MTEYGFNEGFYKQYAISLVVEIGAYYPAVASYAIEYMPQEEILSGIASDVIGHASSSEHSTKQKFQFEREKGRDLSCFLGYSEQYQGKDKAFAPIHRLMVQFRQEADKIINKNNKKAGYTSTRNSIGKQAAACWAMKHAKKLLEIYDAL